MKNTTDYINAMLFTLLGDHNMIAKWWTSPNWAFGGQCPQDVDENLITSYLENFLFK
jgi:hypothetical protein